MVLWGDNRSYHTNSADGASIPWTGLPIYRRGVSVNGVEQHWGLVGTGGLDGLFAFLPALARCAVRSARTVSSLHTMLHMLVSYLPARQVEQTHS
jgi:hypothetical protein